MKKPIEKIPITVGVIGHRDAYLTDAHKSDIKKIFTDLIDKYPQSPIVLFSQLAEGADTDVAKLFLEVKTQRKADFRLVVSLTYEEEYFLKRFDENAKNEFLRIKDDAYRSFVLYKYSRIFENDLYRKGGQFVADSSLVLIALYDGVENGYKGGTADIVNYKISGSFKDEVVSHIFENEGSLINVLCKRFENNDYKSNDNYLSGLLADKSIEKSLAKIESYNRKIEFIGEDQFLNSSQQLLSVSEQEKVSDPKRQLKDFFVILDNLAMQHQLTYLRILKIFFVLGLFILLGFQFYKFIVGSYFVLSGILILIGSALYLYNKNRKIQCHGNFLEHRIIAEALRIQFFWNLAGVRKAAGNNILRIHKAEFSWIKHVLLAIYGYTFEAKERTLDKNNFIKKYWIDDQNGYFKKKLIELKAKTKRFDSILKRIFWCAFFLLFVIAILEFSNKDIKPDADQDFIKILIILDGFLFGIFALIKAYQEKRGYRQIQNQYTLMSTIYDACSVKMNEIHDGKFLRYTREEQIEKLLYMTGKEALIENGNWYLIFKDKNPEVKGIGN